MKVPEKYLRLNASFRTMKSELVKLGISELDVEGCLSGACVSFVSVLRAIFFDPNRPIRTLGVSPSASEVKFVEAVFRLSRAEWGCVAPLSADQFMQHGNFACKKMEFVTLLAKAVISRYPREESIPAICEDLPPKKVPSPHPQDQLALLRSIVKEVADSISELTHQLGEVGDSMSIRFETLEARLSVMESKVGLVSALANSKFAGS